MIVAPFIKSRHYTVLHRFDKQNGANPSAALTVFNDQIFGYARNGAYNYGVVFSIDPDGCNILEKS